MTPQQTVLAAIADLFGRRDLAAVPAYFAPEYRQHSALAPDGPDGLRQLVTGFPPAFRYEPVRVVADGGLVVTHGLYHGFGPAPVLGFDLWRVEDGRIVEHWDALGPVADPDAATTGPTARPDGDAAEAKRLVLGLLRGRVADGEASAASAPTEHEPAGPLSAAGYVAVHHLLAQGDLVFARSEGALGDGAVIINDLWRIDAGEIVEHWGLRAPVPARLPHGNGSF